MSSSKESSSKKNTGGILSAKNIGAGLVGAGGILSAYGSIAEGYEKAAAYREQIGMLKDTNERIKQLTAYNLQALDRDKRSSVSSMSTSSAARGMVMSDKQKLDIAMQAATQEAIMKDAATFEMLKNTKQMGALDDAADSAITAGWISGATSIIGTAGKILTGGIL
jgi:hypothetical protein